MPKKSCISKVALIAIMLMMAGIAPTTYAQKGTSIIKEATNLSFSSLNALQKANYNIIAANPNVQEIKLVRLSGLASVQDSGKVTLDLPFLPCRNLIFHARTVNYTSDSTYEWYGEVRREHEEDSLCSSGFLTLVHYAGKGGLMGSINLNGFDAELQDLGDGIKAVAIMNAEKINKLVCGYTSEEGQSGERPTGPTGLDDCTRRAVKVLLLYTPQAKAAVTFSLFGGAWVSNMWLHATAAIFKTNTIMNNSQVGRNVVLAGVEEIPGYGEGANSKYETDLIAGNPTAQNFRNQYHADIVMLMTKPGGFTVGGATFGNSREIGSYNTGTYNIDPAYAFAVVDAGTSLSQLTFPHELGHLLGARHDAAEDAVSYLPFLDPNARGYKFTKWWGPWIVGRYRTTLTYHHDGDRRTLIPYYSNPDVYYDGKPTGTAAANNTQRIQAHYPVIGSFYTESVPFSNSILVSHMFYPPPAPGMQNICDYYLRVTAQVNDCGRGPYQHTWSISYDGIYWYNPGPGTTQDIFISGTGTLFVKLTTWSFFSGTAIATQNIHYNCQSASYPHSAKAALHQQDPSTSIYPNPANGTFTLQYLSMVEEPVEIVLLDMAGRKLETLYRGSMHKGLNQMELHARKKPAAGTYLLHIQRSTTNERIKLAIQ